MVSYHLAKKAYVKIALHGAKYAVVSVAGLLDGAGHLTVDDSIPLFHNVLPLTSMLEVALEQVDVYCKQTDSAIVGYYFAHESLTDTSITPFTAKVASKIDDAVGGDSLLLVVRG
ncbi:ER membrane protein complex subunit 8, partial [Cladochytrium replicatum]